VEIGVKIAFQYQKQVGRGEKTKFISFDNAYHGDTVGAMSVGGIDIYHEVYAPLLFPTIKAPSPYCYRCQLSPERQSERCALLCLKELERLMELHQGELAGLVIEPGLQGAGGMIVQPEGFVKGVRELCDRFGVLMITDEVAVGFGRTGAMLPAVRPASPRTSWPISKGISGGYLPLAATLLRCIPRLLRRAKDLFSRAHLYRQPHRLRRRLSQPRSLRDRASAGVAAAENRLSS
jgi:adenosylmethionine-8-amino-7-oxononanoate aminotransferase